MRYLDDSRHQLFSKLKAAYPGIKMAKSTFYMNIPEYYKKPSKATDLCHVCEAGKRDEVALHKMEQQRSGSEASDGQRDASKQCLQRRVDYYHLHKRLADVQRKSHTSEVVSRAHPLSRDDGCPFLIGR